MVVRTGGSDQSGIGVHVARPEAGMMKDERPSLVTREWRTHRSADRGPHLQVNLRRSGTSSFILQPSDFIRHPPPTAYLMNLIAPGYDHASPAAALIAAMTMKMI